MDFAGDCRCAPLLLMRHSGSLSLAANAPGDYFIWARRFISTASISDEAIDRRWHCRFLHDTPPTPQHTL